MGFDPWFVLTAVFMCWLVVKSVNDAKVRSLLREQRAQLADQARQLRAMQDEVLGQIEESEKPLELEAPKKQLPSSHSSEGNPIGIRGMQ